MSVNAAKQASLLRKVAPLLVLFVVTTVALLAVSEWAARKILPVSKQTVWNCLVVKDDAVGEQPIPNSECKEQWAEASLVDYKFNSCGYRAGEECGVRPPRVFRIAIVGSSFAMGSRVDREKSFAALLPASLQRMTGIKVDVYDMALHGRGGRPTSVDLRFNDILAEQPNLILWVMTPFDIKSDQQGQPGIPAAVVARAAPVGAVERAKAGVNYFIDRDRLVLLLRHVAYQSQSLYLHSVLPQVDDFGFLLAQPGQLWNDRINHVDNVIARFCGRASHAGIPVALTLMPNRAQAAMLSMGSWPAGYDPYALNARLKVIAATNKIAYFDILPGFRSIPNPEQYYLPVDGHPNAEAHAIFARLIAPQLAAQIKTSQSEINNTPQLGVN